MVCEDRSPGTLSVLGSEEGWGARAPYNVTAHEAAHMWVPKLVATNERRHV